MFTFPQDLMLDEMSLNKWHAEFDILASISFYDKLKEFARSHDMSDAVYDVISRKRNSTYVDLKILGFDALTEEISNLLIDDPDKAGLMLSAAQKFTNPFFYPIKSGQNTNMRRINEIREMGLTGDGLPPQIQKQERTVTYPVEIGSFLMRKTVPNPGSYYGCIEMMERYKANDLYKVLESLDKAIRDHNGDKTVRTVSDLDTILENVWKDASNIGKQKGIIEGGMGISLGALGSFAASMTGAGGGLYEGLLAGLGFMVAEKVLEKHNSSISDRIMRSLNRDYMMNIYDFANRKN